MYRDSFSWSLAPFMKGAFSQLDMLHWTEGVPSRGGLDATLDYDVVMLEVVERNLRDLRIDLYAFLVAFEASRDNLPRETLENVHGLRVPGSSRAEIVMVVCRQGDAGVCVPVPFGGAPLSKLVPDATGDLWLVRLQRRAP
jgi:hypothetical protein